jgi:hypothetical protein
VPPPLQVDFIVMLRPYRWRFGVRETFFLDSPCTAYGKLHAVDVKITWTPLLGAWYSIGAVGAWAALRPGAAGRASLATAARSAWFAARAASSLWPTLSEGRDFRGGEYILDVGSRHIHDDVESVHPIATLSAIAAWTAFASVAGFTAHGTLAAGIAATAAVASILASAALPSGAARSTCT